MRAPHMWPLHHGSDLCLARTPVSEVGLQSPWPNNHTTPLSSPYEGNKIKLKPDPDWFYVPSVCTRAMVKQTLHTHKENIVMSAWLQSISKCVCLNVCLKVRLKKMRNPAQWVSKQKNPLFFSQYTSSNQQQHSTVLLKKEFRKQQLYKSDLPSESLNCLKLQWKVWLSRSPY